MQTKDELAARIEHMIESLAGRAATQTENDLCETLFAMLDLIRWEQTHAL